MLAQFLLQGIERNNFLLKIMAKDLDESLTARPLGESNTMIWILGHITLMRLKALALAGSPIAREPWEKKFDRGAAKTEPVDVSFPELAKLFEERGAALVAAIEKLDDEAFEKQAPRQMPDGSSTLGDVLSFLVFHETLHLGQMELIKVGLGGEGIG